MVIEEKNFKTKKLIKIYTKTYQIKKKKNSTGIMPANHPSLVYSYNIIISIYKLLFFLCNFFRMYQPDQL